MDTSPLARSTATTRLVGFFDDQQTIAVERETLGGDETIRQLHGWTTVRFGPHDARRPVTDVQRRAVRSEAEWICEATDEFVAGLRVDDVATAQLGGGEHDRRAESR